MKWWPVKPDVPDIPQAAPEDVATSEERFESKVDVRTSDTSDLARQVTEDAKGSEGPFDTLAHLLGLGLLAELPRDPLVALL